MFAQLKGVNEVHKRDGIPSDPVLNTLTTIAGVTVGGNLTTSGTMAVTGAITATGGLTLIQPATGSSIVRGHASFARTQKVVKIKIAGVTANDYFYFQMNGTDSTTALNAADRLKSYVKTDTLIVVRPASGTSGLEFDWFRIK